MKEVKTFQFQDINLFALSSVQTDRLFLASDRFLYATGSRCES
jgi:hypothetical protein